ncbi:MAG: carboxylesterase/lipase family protein [Myxococcota bacterium]
MRPVIETGQGRLVGSENKGILLFRGVPYAQPPVGKRRFRPPEPPEPWAGERDASETGASAPQSGALPGPVGRFVGAGSRRSEDCLYLNVWTPGLDDARRPVLVWIHGGAFVLGSGSVPLYSGRRLANRGDVVVVTINYRLGALGFLHLDLLRGDTTGASNLGIRDQVAALRWVREHISEFGGDPENVTIFGESAGGMSVGSLLGVPEAREHVHRAILQSGAAHNVSSAERASRVAEVFLEEVGLPTSTGDGDLERLPVEQILSAQAAAARKLGIIHGTLPWQPAVDGGFLPDQPLAQVRAGHAAKIPLLIGTNRDEWKLFSFLDRATQRMDDDALRRRVERLVPKNDDDGVAWADRAIEVYRTARAGRSRSPVALWNAIQSDRVFRYPAQRLAELQAEHQPQTFKYLFEWTPRLGGRRVGACHALEIPFVFGTLRHPLVRPVLGTGSEARGLSRSMQESWLSFARSGRPEAVELPEWEPYEPGRRATLVLGQRSHVAFAPAEDERRFWSHHLASPGR